MKGLQIVAALALASVFSVTVVAAQSAKPMKEEKPGMLARATVSADSARKLALAQVPRGRIDEEEIEEEHGKLVFSFDIKVPGQSGVDEVLIDALTGAIVSKSHETPRQAAQERASDAAAAKKPARP